MPYTPPAQRSPAVSRPDSPPRSRDGPPVRSLPRSSPFMSEPGPRPNLPRSSSSTSYLHKHRRSPSSPVTSFSSPSLDATARKVESIGSNPKSSLRQSPPPLNNLTIPTGAVMSPPDSGQNSSDDEPLTLAGRHRGRKLDNLVELQAAIEHIELERELSPQMVAEKNMAKNALTLDTSQREPQKLQLTINERPPLSKEARKISHSRSATESDAYLPDINRSHSYSPPASSSDSDLDDEAAAGKPPMLRKKSGELVRPALRPPSARRRPSSMPGTPTFGKAVHFSNDLEHVRHFLQVDKPLAVSAETSPAEAYESEVEFPFQPSTKSQGPSHEWEIRLANFPADMSDRPSAPIKVERVFLSPDKKTLIGTVAVQNLAFHKTIHARFTFDYWKTTSEVGAEFSHDVRRQAAKDELDRFNFQIRLADQVNLERKTLFFCVRYAVAGQEFWDSNNSMNYQVDFSKKQAPAKTKQSAGNDATRHINGLPRSRSPRESTRRKPAFDDFGRGFDAHWDQELLPRSQSASSILQLDESNTAIKFRNKPAANGSGDALAHRQKQLGSQAFAHRYDFGASLSAAITAASTALGDRSGFAPQFASKPSATAPATATSQQPSEPAPETKPTALTSEKPPAQSQSYNELLEKYCFFGSAKGSPRDSPSPTNNKTADQAKFYPGVPDLGSGAPSPVRIASVEAARAAGRVPGPSVSLAASSMQDVDTRAASPSFGYPYHQALGNSLPACATIHG